MPPLPTPFPIPTPDPLAPTINAEVFWTFDAYAPALSMMQSVWLWANQYNMLTYAIVLSVIIMIINWMLHFVVTRASGGSGDV